MLLTLVQKYALCSQPTPLHCKGCCPSALYVPSPGIWEPRWGLTQRQLPDVAGWAQIWGAEGWAASLLHRCLLVTLGKVTRLLHSAESLGSSLCVLRSSPAPGPVEAQSLLCEWMAEDLKVSILHFP